jgi:hypothetical protein
LRVPPQEQRMRTGIASAITILIIGMGVSGCDSDDATVSTEPSAFSNQLDMVIVPSVLDRHGCRSLSPFPVPFVLNVTAGTRPLILSEVRIQPTNPFGRTEPPTIFDSSSLTRRFGSATVERFGTRQFHFTHDFWCNVGGDLGLVWVTTTDGAGIERVSRMSVPVR